MSGLTHAHLPLIFMGGWIGYAVRQGAGLAVPLTFLKFSRGFEEEVNLLEKLDAMEKRKPGTLSEMFRSHPNVSSRIKSTQQNLNELLHAKTEYVITTSEFAEVQRELQQIMMRPKAAESSKAPTLRRPIRGAQQVEVPEKSTDADDERPKLKRRPLV